MQWYECIPQCQEWLHTLPFPRIHLYGTGQPNRHLYVHVIRLGRSRTVWVFESMGGQISLFVYGGNSFAQLISCVCRTNRSMGTFPLFLKITCRLLAIMVAEKSFRIWTLLAETPVEG